LIIFSGLSYKDYIHDHDHFQFLNALWAEKFDKFDKRIILYWVFQGHFGDKVGFNLMNIVVNKLGIGKPFWVVQSQI